AAYPAEYDFHVVLRDGGLARIRPVTTDDAERMKGMFRRMGRESIYHRFFTHKQGITDEEIEYFTTVDYHDRMAFVAEIGQDIVAVGRYDRMEDDPSAAEVAFEVEDAHHGRGLGSHLLSHLTNYARNDGVTAFRAFVLAENYPMMRLFRGSGYRMKRGMGEGVYEVEFPVEKSDEALRVESAHEQLAVANSLLPIFYPRSVAIIGASRDQQSIGGRLMRNVLDARFNGAVFPVNPNSPAVGSVKAYRSVLDIPDPIDVAVVVVPAKYVVPVVEECAQKGVKGLVVISAGFSETGAAGAALELELRDTVRASGMRMIGPNCMGMLNTDPAVNLDLTFSPTYPPRGNVAMSSQSGALGIAILDYADKLDIGISSFVSVGNKADVSANDLLLYWEGDPATDVILLYVESFGHPRRFARIARRIGKAKPIIAVKSGRTSAGARAASSHTGALASVEVAVSALFRQAGVIRVDTLEQMFEAASLLANQPLPQGRRVAVLTNAGGPGILCVDALESEGLSVPELSPELQGQLQAHLSSDAAVRNPVDMIASAGPDQFEACLTALLDSDEVDAVIVIFIPTSPGALKPIHTAVHQAVARGTRGKTMLTVFMEADAGEIPKTPPGAARLPNYTFPEPAARALARAARYADWIERPEGEVAEFHDLDVSAAQEVICEALARLGADGGWLEPNEAEAVVAAFGISQAASKVATTREEAIEAAAEIGTSVVLKVIAPSALHKSDVGGIVLDVKGAEAVGAAFDRVTSVVDDAEGALVQEFVGAGHEVIVGMAEDPSFGPLIAFGLGGVFVELIGDVAFRIHPLTDVDAAEMIAEVKSARLLDGYRGGPAGDVEALKETLLRLSALVEALPEVAEFDLNPVKVLEPGSGLRVVDMRIRVRPVPQRWLPSRKDIPAAQMRGR
ncbi:MAG: GNAT family N-acetyltransferase, partial [Acidimicrobiia bacterium]|nr:GNAT family N-acetyltransferase [Acidimicrobiia bacterium]